MNDSGINVFIILMIVFAFMGVMRSRGMARGHRRLQKEFDQLRFAQAAAPAMLPGAGKDQVERLEDRVRVLERIVTDGGFNLAAEIEALRDKRDTVQ
ncbi:MAG: hypothetical protein ABIT09_10925 [Croceibacterium sp.]